MSPHLTILGSGPAGLATGLFARRRGLPFTIHEASHRVGGNCATLEQDGFRFDTGAHRLHDRDPEMMAEIGTLLGDDLRRVDVPSQVWLDGRMVDFPLAPLDLLSALGPVAFSRCVFEVLRARLSRPRSRERDLETLARRRYGDTLARLFLLEYSEKLWGVPAGQLSPDVAGKRLRGLGLRSVVTETLLGRAARTRHLEGSAFHYPRLGYGTIAERMAEECGGENVMLGSRVTRVSHDGSRIVSIELNGERTQAVDRVVSSLPLGLLVHLLEPKLDDGVLEVARGLRFRNLVAVVLFLRKASVTQAATVYFPSPDIPFTRVAEPRNRSADMSPPGCTSLVAELPCDPGDATWTADDDDACRLVREHLQRIGWFSDEEVMGSTVLRLPHAYPVLELGFEERVAELSSRLSTFENLHSIGRNGRFVYAWLHDMMRFGHEVVEEIAS